MALGLSQSKFAARLGVSFASVNRWESGQRLPSRRAWILIGRLETGLHSAVTGRSTDHRDSGSPAPARTNLPASPNVLIGRADDVVEVRGLVDRSPVVTLTGPGGIGKTRLALEVARQLVPDFPDGVRLVELSPISDPDLLPLTIAAALGVAAGEVASTVSSLTSYLASRRLLLVLDNCEHLIDSVALLVDALIRRGPDLRILATSRELLDVEGEIVWPVPPLPARGPDRADLASTFPLAAAAQLFADRAASRRPDFVVHAGNLDAVLQICDRLDGLPLAIELVAVQLDSRSLDDIAIGLDHGLSYDESVRRGGPPRQRSLRSAIDWSYDLLSEAERRLFERLGVFAGAFDLDAAEAIATVGDSGSRGEFIGLLAKLVRKSLVQVQPAGRLARYRLLHTLRGYARERLAERGDLVATRLRHAAYYRALAVRAAAFRYGPAQGAWFDRLDHEIDELRLALQTLTDADDHEAALQLAASLGRFWTIRGYLEEGFAALERLLALTEGATLVTRLAALRAGGVIAREMQKLRVARAWSEEHRSLAKQLGDEAGLGWALANLGIIAAYEGEIRCSAPLLIESLARFRGVGDPIGTSWAIGYLANVQFTCEHLEAAAALSAEAVAAFRETGDTFGIAWVLGLKAQIANSRDDDVSARRLSESALNLAERIGARNLAASLVHRLGLFATLDPNLLRRSLELYYGVHDPRGITISLLMVGCLGIDRGEPARAVSLLAAAEATCRDYHYLFSALPPRQRGRIEAARRAARASLGEEAFTVVWTEGSLFSLANAVQRAAELSRTLEAQGLEPRLSLAVDHTPGSSVVPAAMRLTSRERQVLDQVATGASNAGIARDLGVSVRTVDRHLTNIYAKLGVANRAGAAAFILRHAP